MSERPRIAVVDYGAGNLVSIEQALTRVGAAVDVVHEPRGLERADGLLVPGVGAAAPAMDRLRAAGLVEPIRAWINDQTKGIGYLFALRELAHDIDKNWKKVLQKFEAMRAALINSKTLLCNVTLDSENWKLFKPQLEKFISELPSTSPALKDFEIHPVIEKEGIAIPAQVNYVGKGANLYDLGYEFDGSSDVILGYLRMAYLWEKIRVQGGAYGAHVQFDESTGVISFLS